MSSPVTNRNFYLNIKQRKVLQFLLKEKISTCIEINRNLFPENKKSGINKILKKLIFQDLILQELILWEQL